MLGSYEKCLYSFIHIINGLVICLSACTDRDLKEGGENKRGMKVVRYAP